MKITAFEFNLFGELTYVMWDEHTSQAAVIDPGMSNSAEEKQLATFIADNHLTVKYMLFTHLHIDHTFGSEFVRNTYGVGVTAHEADLPLGLERDSQARMFRLRVGTLPPLTIDSKVTHGDELMLGSEKIIVIHVPGHSKGSVAYYCPQSGFVVTGDALFRGSIGRTDLPGGNHSELIRSIAGRLLTLPESTVVYPGHGPSTTIGFESRMNPYI